VLAPVLMLWASQRGGIEGALLVPATLALLTAAWVWALPERRGFELQEDLVFEPD